MPPTLEQSALPSSLERREIILQTLREKGHVPVQSLLDETRASPATLRRDLVFLESRGKLVRTHGGVIHPQRLAGEAAFASKQNRATRQKKAIARALVDAIEPGAAVFIDAGSTCLEVGSLLIERGRNPLYTNSIPLLGLAARSQAPIHAIGGEVRPISQALVGTLGLTWLDALRFDYAVIGASALIDSSGAYTTELHEAAIKSKVLTRAQHNYLAADSGKLAEKAPVRFAGWNNFSTWFTDDGLPARQARTLSQNHHLRIIRAT
jgi:DeoR/GlpR family transcriptional regulator of sugar metabolism